MLNINSGGLDGGSGKLVDDEKGSTSFRYWIRQVMLHLATNGDDEDGGDETDEDKVMPFVVVVVDGDDEDDDSNEDGDDEEEGEEEVVLGEGSIDPLQSESFAPRVEKKLWKIQKLHSGWPLPFTLLTWDWERKGWMDDELMRSSSFW